ncbi:MAG: Flp pilus assembly complex ATPase component TadA [Candidatus Diapherotrites archaeon]|nr:Flp pilus assembly complex ATPase component TadA [Candidatus Diapherotrites archaeon]
MKIGGFKVGEYVVKEEGRKKHLVFDCAACVYRASIADDKACMYHTLYALNEIDADIVVLSEVYERIYDEKQTAMLKEIVKLIQKFSIETPWSYNNLADVRFIRDESLLSARHKMIVTITHDLIAYDPISAYFTCLREITRERERYASGSGEYKAGSAVYLKTLLYIKKSFESCELIKKVKRFITELREVPDSKDLYRTFFEAQIKPAFIGSRLIFKEEEGLELLDEYTVKNSVVQIFSHPNQTQNLYFINPPEYTLSPEKYFVLSKAKEIVAGYTPGKASLSTVARSREYFERIYRSTIMEIAEQYQIKLTKKEIGELSEIVARYSVGYGILEILLSDRKLTDIYLDSPIGETPLYVVHSDFEQCLTNVLYTEREAEALITKLRAMSGRPFDEAHPVLDFDLPELETRVAVIGPPLAPDGVAFAFRLHKITPWTLPQFIDVKYLNPLAAGLISFFIDNQATMLVTGSRGSGKTSLLGACILEIPKNTRIIVQEDTLEIPVTYMKKIGLNIQRLKTRSPISVSKTEAEVEPEEALRTALRLGNSALVIGEVRSKEARTLYEAMRIGAAGNVVMGTIHGDSAYAVWDRVVNDLDVPTTSFKATDVVITARPIRFYGSLRRQRRIVEITEIRKHWIEEPAREGGLLDLMRYSAKTDSLELLEDNLKESELFEKISKTSGLSMEEMWKDIRMRAESKRYLVELKKKHDIPELLEAEYTTMANDKLMLIKEKQIREFGKVNYDEVLQSWKKWVRERLLSKLIKKA